MQKSPLRSFFQAGKTGFKILLGLLGGFVVGLLIALLFVHLKGPFPENIPSLFVLAPLALFFSALAGAFAPRFFMFFFLCPLSFFLNDSGGEHLGNDCDSWSEWAVNVAYLLGLILFGIGFLFSSTVFVVLGLAGITIFAIGVWRGEYRAEENLKKNA